MYRAIDIGKIPDKIQLSFAGIIKNYHISRRTLEVARREGRLRVLAGKPSVTTGAHFKNYLEDPKRKKTSNK